MPRPTVEEFIPSDDEHERNERLIVEHLAFARDLGFATCTDEMGHQVPVELNCWPDLWSLIDFRNRNSPAHDNVLAALEARPRMVVGHNYDEGSSLLMPELAQLKKWTAQLLETAEFALSKRDIKYATRCYRAVGKIASETVSRWELIATLVASSITHRAMASLSKNQKSGLLTVAQSSELATAFRPAALVDPYAWIKHTFITDLADVRRVDYPNPESPVGTSLPEPLPPTSSATIPQTKIARLAYRWLLEQWLPTLNQLSKPNPGEGRVIFADLLSRKQQGFTPEPQWTSIGGWQARVPPVYCVERFECLNLAQPPDISATIAKNRLLLHSMGVEVPLIDW
ncbi:MAG TPA: hypothetical protein VK171_07820 [Fimbriimonas sp.]|nr:hypothetical protein [Fimbriimonas sp.]